MFMLFRAKPIQQAAELAYQRVVEQARQPGFYLAGGVPDTVDGRFELICLHAFIYLDRLRTERSEPAALGQCFFDAMFADFDRSLREMGTGDLSVGREVRRMAEAFYGRISAYRRGLADGDAALQAALARNLFGTARATPAQLLAMAEYLRREAVRFEHEPGAELLAGRLSFGPPPQPAMAEAAV
jgi:cytochrome b pre-mRNA-processing protein 3